MKTMSQQYKLPKLPKSSKKLITALAENSPLTQKELIMKVSMPAKTVRYALKRLSEEGIISEIPNLEDMRSVFYTLNPMMEPSLLEAHIQEAKKVLEQES